MGYERDCSFEEYQQANFIYMMAGDMDKQAFCKEYKKAGHSPLVLELAKAENIIDIALRDKIEKGKRQHAPYSAKQPKSDREAWEPRQTPLKRLPLT